MARTEDEPCLPGGDGQVMRTLDVLHVVVLQIGVHAFCDGRECGSDLASIANLLTLAQHRPEMTGRSLPMIFNASYLVADAETEQFHAEFDRLGQDLAGLGIELERTGPWPPYNFVPGAIGAAW